MNVLISACLIGVNCKYNGKNNLIDKLDKLMSVCTLIPACPEQLGGLKTPRNPAEIVEGHVRSNDGIDVTYEYNKGAEEALKLAKLYNCKIAILKEKSPSCGYGKIYDGTFSHTSINGNGVAANLFIQNGIKVYGESEIDKFLCELEI
ncbi:DUF523 domain-containing protein [Sedimentibacter sp. zth1]|uniref:DUF523 domain-containing protein n=1 Tax=Sedimentibacter sp. zth1 TaxID=2816908 RepID=UPI001A9286F1|nr:DUF523 domain-containing protein [Sedimentibacter sp. zth1]QSX06345.1 DUF523 domain-containing protein [Sedimentibacter sp. zth1]